MQKILLALTGILMTPLLSAAHGGDKPGPHGGNVEMPGAFHTEVVMENDQSIKVYLIDMNFQNATSKDSSVAVSFKNKKNPVNFTCSAVSDYFHCVPSKKYPLKDVLVVKATRENAIGNEAIYKLPLKFGSTNKPQSSESLEPKAEKAK